MNWACVKSVVAFHYLDPSLASDNTQVVDKKILPFVFLVAVADVYAGLHQGRG
jgi:hypothetical protein